MNIRFQECKEGDLVIYSACELYHSEKRKVFNSIKQTMLKTLSWEATIAKKNEHGLVLNFHVLDVFLFRSPSSFHKGCMTGDPHLHVKDHRSIEILQEMKSSSDQKVVGEFEIMVDLLTNHPQCVNCNIVGDLENVDLSQFCKPGRKPLFIPTKTLPTTCTASTTKENIYKRKYNSVNRCKKQPANHLQSIPALKNNIDKFNKCQIGDRGVFKLLGVIHHNRLLQHTEFQQKVLQHYSLDVTVVDKREHGAVLQFDHFNTRVHVFPNVMTSNYNVHKTVVVPTETLSAATLEGMQQQVNNNVYRTIETLLAQSPYNMVRYAPRHNNRNHAYGPAVSIAQPSATSHSLLPPLDIRSVRDSDSSSLRSVEDSPRTIGSISDGEGEANPKCDHDNEVDSSTNRKKRTIGTSYHVSSEDDHRSSSSERSDYSSDSSATNYFITPSANKQRNVKPTAIAINNNYCGGATIVKMKKKPARSTEILQPVGNGCIDFSRPVRK